MNTKHIPTKDTMPNAISCGALNWDIFTRHSTTYILLLNHSSKKSLDILITDFLYRKHL